MKAATPAARTAPAAAWVVKRLESLGDPVKAAGVQRYFRETVRSFGVAGPVVRALARELHGMTRREWRTADAVALCDRLFRRPELEAKGVAALVLLYRRRDFEPPLFRTIRGWLRRGLLANWASVDLLCPGALGALLARHPALLAEIEAWAGDANRWVRRASIVAFLKLVKRPEHLDPAYAMAARHFTSRDDLVQKAAGWLLREAGKTDPERLERFLLRHGPAVPRTTLRYAIERFPEHRRKRLLAATRSRKD